MGVRATGVGAGGGEGVCWVSVGGGCPPATGPLPEHRYGQEARGLLYLPSVGLLPPPPATLSILAGRRPHPHTLWSPPFPPPCRSWQAGRRPPPPPHTSLALPPFGAPPPTHTPVGLHHPRHLVDLGGEAPPHDEASQLAVQEGRGHAKGGRHAGQRHAAVRLQELRGGRGGGIVMEPHRQ